MLLKVGAMAPVYTIISFWPLFCVLEYVRIKFVLSHLFLKLFSNSYHWHGRMLWNRTCWGRQPLFTFTLHTECLDHFLNESLIKIWLIFLNSLIFSDKFWKQWGAVKSTYPTDSLWQFAEQICRRSSGCTCQIISDHPVSNFTFVFLRQSYIFLQGLSDWLSVADKVCVRHNRFTFDGVISTGAISTNTTSTSAKSNVFLHTHSHTHHC